MRPIMICAILLMSFVANQSLAKNIIIDKKIVSYRLIPVMKGNDLKSVELVINFYADADGHTTIDLPDEWGGGVKYYEALKALKITGASTVSAPTPSQRLLVSKPYAPLRVSYHIDANRNHGQDVPLKDNYTYPVIAPDWFYIVGPSLIATVEERDTGDIHFSWKLPKDWTGATNLEFALPVNSQGGASQAVFFAGKDVQVTHMKIKNSDLRIAWRGKFTNFTPDIFNNAVFYILEAEQAFWSEGQDNFLVTIAPMDSSKNSASIRGSGLGDSFAMVATPESDIGTLKIILAHEYFHSWNPIRLGGFDEGEDERTDYWFSEGFTDYYGRKLAYESGAIDAMQFADSWNEALKAYSASSMRTKPNSVIAKQFWSDYEAQKMPYQRGAQLAALLDAKWRRQGKSLDGFMYVLRDQIKADEREHLPHLKLIDRLNRAAKAYGVDFDDLIETHIINGAAIVLPEDAFGSKFKVISEDIPVRYLGYNAEKSRDSGQFVAVDPDGPAYKAGIREGMKRISSEGGSNDSQTPIIWHVLDLEGKPATFTFKPEGKTIVHSQKVIVQ